MCMSVCVCMCGVEGGVHVCVCGQGGVGTWVRACNVVTL